MLNSGIEVKTLNLDSKSCLLFQKFTFWTQIWLQNPYCLPPLLYINVPCYPIQQQKQDRLRDCGGLCPALWLYKGNSSYRSGCHLTESSLIHNVITTFFGKLFQHCWDSVYEYSILLSWCTDVERESLYMSVGIWRIKTCWRETLIFQSEKSKVGGQYFPNTALWKLLLITIEDIIITSLIFKKYCN